MKNNYQGVIVLRMSGAEDSVDDLVNQVGKELEAEGATLKQIDRLGRKEFAYNARHLSHGYYVNYQFEAEPDAIKKMRSKLALNDGVHLQHYQKK